MLTAADKASFVAALAELAMTVRPESVLASGETMAGLRQSWGRPRRHHRAGNGVELHIWWRIEATPRSPAQDVYAADFGAARAVLVRSSQAVSGA